MTIEDIEKRLVGRTIVAVKGYIQEEIGDQIGFCGTIMLDDGTTLADIGLHGNESAIVLEKPE